MASLEQDENSGDRHYTKPIRITHALATVSHECTLLGWWHFSHLQHGQQGWHSYSACHQQFCVATWLQDAAEAHYSRWSHQSCYWELVISATFFHIHFKFYMLLFIPLERLIYELTKKAFHFHFLTKFLGQIMGDIWRQCWLSSYCRYPASDDDFGLLLEDDIEVSPFYYMWLKYAVLSYHYDPTVQLPELNSIALYTPRVVEVVRERPHWNATNFFKLIHPNMPYLHQLPCSWGALFFPKHWRQFYKYMGTRFTEDAKENPVQIPRSRTNGWQVSLSLRELKEYSLWVVHGWSYLML